RAGHARPSPATVAAMEPGMKPRLRIAPVLAGLVAGAALLPALAWIGLLAPAPGRAQDPPPQPVTGQAARALVAASGGACPLAPPPEVMPGRAWPRSVDPMAHLAANLRGEGFIPAEAPPHIKAFYHGSAPAELPRLAYLPPS